MMKHWVNNALWITWIAVAWKTVYAYWSPYVDRFLVPPGDDPLFHAGRIAEILEGHWQLFYLGYPQGLHLLFAAVAKPLGWNGLTALQVLTPLLLILPIPILYVAGTSLFKRPLAGALAALVWSLLALAPIRAYGDGNYPNLLAASLFLPLAMLGLYLFTQKASRTHLAIFLGAALGILFTHHLTMVFLILSSLPFILGSTIEKLRHSRSRGRAIRFLISSFILLLGVGILIWRPMQPLVGPYLQTLLANGSLQTVLSQFSTPVSVVNLLETHSLPFIILGAAGCIYLLCSRLSWQLKLLFVSWIGVTLALSATAILGLPGRFVRELAIPLSLAGGWMIAEFFQLAPKHLVLRIVALASVIFIVAAWLVSFSRPFGLPEPFKPLIRVQHDEEPAFAMLQNITNPDDVILANNSNPYLPYLVNRKVVIASQPAAAAQFVAEEPITAVYVGARPPLSSESVYPFFANFDPIKEAILALPGLELVGELPSGSKVYKLNR